MPPPSRKGEVLALLPDAMSPDWPSKKLLRSGTVAHLSAATGMVKTAVCNHLRRLHEEQQAHIGRWLPTTGKPAPVWVLGPGEHAPVPARKTSTQYSKVHRRRVARAIDNAKKGFNFDDRYAGHVALAQTDDLVKAKRANPVTWLSALGL